nr:NAD-dependent epimerase/dehydratase family protein [Actinomycetota bacterium]
MRLLIIGGTRFLGRALVEDALARGHEVTLFNRGQTNPELFPEAEKIHGDRDGGLSALEG